MAVADLGFNMSATASAIKELRIKNVTPTPTVCPYCASGCGLVVDPGFPSFYTQKTARNTEQ
jgi:formate dehydrogenase major subunit